MCVQTEYDDVNKRNEIVGSRTTEGLHCMKVINLHDWMKVVWKTGNIHHGGEARMEWDNLH